MAAKSILQVVSGFKPNVDGMGDFARLLGDTLTSQHALRSHFLVYRQPKKEWDRDEILPNTISYPSEATPSAFKERLSGLLQHTSFECALLHYGPYGYSSDGKPAAFVQTIEELATTMPVLVFFHELFASGPPWKRAFWTRGEQRNCVKSLLQISTASFTSNAEYLERLQRLNTAGRPLTKIPIFSNVGEPDELRPLASRSRQLVVFGQLHNRIRLYREHRADLEEACRALRIETIVDVGSGQSESIPATLAEANVTSRGWMDEQGLSEILADSIAGILGYWPDVWEKSGVMAAYQAHAVVPILVALEKRRTPEPDFVPYVTAASLSQILKNENSARDDRIQAIADAAHSYYQQYQSVKRCADVIFRYTSS